MISRIACADQLLLAPAQRNADIAWFSLGPVGDLTFDAVSFWLQKFLPKLKQLLGQSCERLLPTRFLLVDGAPVVGKKRIRKATDFHLGETIVHGPVEPFVIGYTGRAFQLVEQGLFFGIHRRLLAHLLGSLFGFN